MLRKIIKFLIIILITVLIIDPGDLIFHLKVPLFVLIFLIWIFLKTVTPIRFNRDIIINCIIFFLIPLVGICVAISQNNMDDQTFAIGFIKSFLVIFLIFITIDLRLILSPYLIKCCFLIPLIIIPIYILITINPNNILEINNYVTIKDVAKFSHRGYYGYEVLMLFYRTSPLLVFPLAYYCSQFFFNKRRKLLNFIIILCFFFTLFLSGTRANILSDVLIVVYFIFDFLIKKRNKAPLIFTSILFLFILFSFIGTLSFRETDPSTEIKSGHLNSYMKLFEENPQYLLWGSGLGSKFYSSGNDSNVSQTELTYFDLIRWFGFPIALILLFLIFYPVIYLYNNNRINTKNKPLILAYFAYLFIVGTNPLLVSSTGMLAIVTMYSLLRDDCNEKIDRQIVTS